MSALLEAALGYAARGWPVFPCMPDGTPEPDHKAPLGRLAPHGFKDASTEAAVITRWWSRCPAANVAIATGAPAVDVVDVDNKPGGSGFKAFNRLVRAGMMAGALALVRTPSGGLHAYRTGTDQRCGSLPRLFLDFKACGGYVLAPPSIVGGRPYELLDERGEGEPIEWPAVCRFLDPPAVRPAQPYPAGGGGVAALAGWLATQEEGNRNSALFWAACRAVESGAGAGELAQLRAAAVETGLGGREAEATLRSAARRAGVAV